MSHCQGSAVRGLSRLGQRAPFVTETMAEPFRENAGPPTPPHFPNSRRTSMPLPSMYAPHHVCASCRGSLLAPGARRWTRALTTPAAPEKPYRRPSFAPKPLLDLKHMRQNPGLYEQNSRDRNHADTARNAWRIQELHEKLLEQQRRAQGLRRLCSGRTLEMQRRAGANMDTLGDEETPSELETWMRETKALKAQLQDFQQWEARIKAEMEGLALGLVNLSSKFTPTGTEPRPYRGAHAAEIPPQLLQKSKSHVEIGRELDILDFEAGAATSGWGWYFLKNSGTLLEQALVQFALQTAIKGGWRVVTPPSMVYAHVASACGFAPRDNHGESQIYHVARPGHTDSDADADADKPSHVLAGTAEIPLAALHADKTLAARDLPLKVVGVSRSFRAEAGARGARTKGLYRVHEFTKVELFAWTAPPYKPTKRFLTGEADPAVPAAGAGAGPVTRPDGASTQQGRAVFGAMIEMQKRILSQLGLHTRVLEMPMSDLGASAARKVDIEAFFPSRRRVGTGDGDPGDSGFGEVTSASACFDYQSRRLRTKVDLGGPGGVQFAYTLNGTALAVPRVLACLLETHWDEETRSVKVPVCLWPFMLGGVRRIVAPGAAGEKRRGDKAG